MAVVLAIVLGILALAFVLYPLAKSQPLGQVQRLKYQRKREDLVVETPEANSQAKDGLAEKEQSARSALQEVELDYQLGNIAEPDYQVLRERYMQQALTALKSRYEREQEIDDEIEEQLRTMKEEYEKADK